MIPLQTLEPPSAASVTLYCEPGALSPGVRALQAAGKVRLIHFAFDPGSLTSKIDHSASPSGARWQDLAYSWAALKALGITWEDLDARGRIPEISRIVGAHNRRDVLHINSAYLSGCAAMLTRDTDILVHRVPLHDLLGLVFLHPDGDAPAIAALAQGK